MPEFIYVLLNSSLPELRKIGRTTLQPTDRAAGLSTPTGVPTPFVVAWWEEVSSSVIAEQEIHEELSCFRENQRREFFRLDCKRAIECVREVCKRFPPSPPNSDPTFRETDFGPWIGKAQVNASAQVVQFEDQFFKVRCDGEQVTKLLTEASRFKYSLEQTVEIVDGELISARLLSDSDSDSDSDADSDS